KAKEQAEALFVAARLRRMPPNAFYDSLVTAGHLEHPKHPPGTFLVERTIRIPIYEDLPTTAMMMQMNAAPEEAATTAAAEGEAPSQPAGEEASALSTEAHDPMMTALPGTADPYAAEGGFELPATAMAGAQGTLAGVEVLRERPEDQVAR